MLKLLPTRLMDSTIVTESTDKNGEVDLVVSRVARYIAEETK